MWTEIYQPHTHPIYLYCSLVSCRLEHLRAEPSLDSISFSLWSCDKKPKTGYYLNKRNFTTHFRSLINLRPISQRSPVKLFLACSSQMSDLSLKYCSEGHDLNVWSPAYSAVSKAVKSSKSCWRQVLVGSICLFFLLWFALFPRQWSHFFFFLEL